MRTISIINLKGGTGKTVTTINMAAILADEYRRRVLVIDADPQHNTSDFYGAKNPSNTIRGILTAYGADWPSYVYRTGREGIDLIPSDMGLVDCDIAAVLHAQDAESYTLGGFIGQLRDANAYDIILVDCPPSFTAASVAAILASDEIIMPVKIDAFSLGGLGELRQQISGLQRLKREIPARALITMWRKTDAIRQGEALLRRSSVQTFKSVIRYSPKMDESTFARESVTEWSATSAAARDYRAFVKEWADVSKLDTISEEGN